MKHLLAAASFLLAFPRLAGAAPMRFGGWIDVYPDVSQIEAHPELFDSVSLGMYGIRKDGRLQRSDRVPDRTAFMKWAREHSVKVFATLGCDKRDAPGCLEGKALDRCLAETKAVCERLGFDGVDVDIEELGPAARRPYLKFIKALRDALKAMQQPRTLSVTVQSFANAEEESESFLDYSALARLADEVRVMHYNCPWGEPGPIMPRADFASNVAYARSRIPADKYVAAVPWYGMDWNVPDDESEDILWRMTDKETGLSSLNELVARYGGAPAWREPEGELSFSYTAEGKWHEVWVPDAKSFDWMVDVIRKAGAAGVYAYQLEYADPDCLAIVQEKVKR